MIHPTRPHVARIAFVLSSLLACAAQAKTFTALEVDALANCVSVDSGKGAVPSVYLPLEPGKYLVTVKSSTATFCTQGTCPHPNVVVTLIDEEAYVSDTFVIRPDHETHLNPTGQARLYAYIPDTYCQDNLGSTILKFAKQ